LKYMGSLFANRLKSRLTVSPLVDIVFPISNESCRSRANTNLGQAAVANFLNIFSVGPDMQVAFAVDGSIWFTSCHLADVFQWLHLLEPVKLGRL
jgi:hypothetical protein